MHKQPSRGGKFVFFYEYEWKACFGRTDIKRHSEFVLKIILDGVKFHLHQPQT